MKETEYFIVTMSNPVGELSQVFNSIEDARKFANILPVEEGYRVAIHSNTVTPVKGVVGYDIVYYLTLGDLQSKFPRYDLPGEGEFWYLLKNLDMIEKYSHTLYRDAEKVHNHIKKYEMFFNKSSMKVYTNDLKFTEDFGVYRPTEVIISMIDSITLE